MPALIDEEAVADAFGDPSLLAAKQRLALARSVLSVASKQRIIAALPSAEDSAALVLQSRPTSMQHIVPLVMPQYYVVVHHHWGVSTAHVRACGLSNDVQ